jgi:hypothetical protein
MKKLPLILPIISLIFFSLFKLSVIPILAQEGQKENAEEAEIIIPENSLFCTDFGLEYYKNEGESLSAMTKESIESSCGNDLADIELKDQETKNPDFSIMDSRLQSTLPKLMPIQLGEKVNLYPESLETRAKHFLVAKEGASSCSIWEPPPDNTNIESVAETKFTLPGWWTHLLGQTKIFCGLFSASERCIPPEKLTIKIAAPDPEEISSGIDLSKDRYSECKPAGEPAKGIAPELKTENPKSNFLSEWIKRTFLKGQTEKGENIYVTQTEKKASLENKTRGELVGGHTLVNQSEFFSNFIPNEINSSINDSPLASEAKYNISEDLTIAEGDEKAANKENYQEQNQVRMRNCLQLCSLYPPDPKFDVSLIDPICISCNPKDY